MNFYSLGLAAATLFIGAIIGLFIAGLKNKGVKNTLQERNNQLSLQLENLQTAE